VAPSTAQIVTLAGTTLEISVIGPDRVVTGGTELSVEPLGGGEYRVTAPGRAPRHVLVARAGSVLWAFSDGETYQVEVAPPGRRRAAAAHHERLSAPMPAAVLQVLVKAGDRVARGDTLILLEAMKMELPLRAPHEGRVKAVRCSVGDLVTPDTTLVELED
jgi:biotin carboxyl carrier protein